MSTWRELTYDQLKALTTHRLYNVYKMLQVSVGYDAFYEASEGEESDDELLEKARFIKAELDTRGHIERKEIPADSERAKARRKTIWEWPLPEQHKPVGPIKHPEDCVGEQVYKTSGKPFKSKNKYNTVKAVTENPHTHLVAFSFEEDSSLVDVHVCNRRRK